MKITKQQLQQIIKEEMEAELSEDKYATEDDRPLGTGRSLMSDKDAREALKTAEMLYKEIGTRHDRDPQQPEPLLRTSMLFWKKGCRWWAPDGPVGRTFFCGRYGKITKVIIVTRPESHSI